MSEFEGSQYEEFDTRNKKVEKDKNSVEKKEKTPDQQLNDVLMKKQRFCQDLLDKASIDDIADHEDDVLSGIVKKLEVALVPHLKQVPDGAIANISSYIEYVAVGEDDKVVTLRYLLSASKRGDKLSISLSSHGKIA